jgi:hypothetical protein
VSTVPAQIALQRTPLPTKSAAIDLVNPITAAFVTPEARRLITPLMELATENVMLQCSTQPSAFLAARVSCRVRPVARPGFIAFVSADSRQSRP